MNSRTVGWNQFSRGIPPDTALLARCAAAPSAPASAPAAGSGARQNYTVQSGDTLSAIADHFATTVEAIEQSNGITNPDLLSVGQQLLIPA